MTIDLECSQHGGRYAVFRWIYAPSMISDSKQIICMSVKENYQCLMDWYFWFNHILFYCQELQIDRAQVMTTL